MKRSKETIKMSRFNGFDEEGHQRSNNRDESGIEYRPRPFSELVDEDKHGLVTRKFLGSLFGGYRI